MAEFTSNATAVGGRSGRVHSNTGSYDHQTVMPGAPADGVTPEELIAGAWAACYGSALAAVAKQRGIDAGGVEIAAAVTLDSDVEKAQFDIVRAELSVDLSGDDQEVDQVIADAHRMCPVSKLIENGARDVTVHRA